MNIIKWASKRKIEKIEKIQEENNLKRILKGIYIIENYYRNIVFRIFEYILFVLNIILNKLFKIPIKNLTLGNFQIGITSILNYYGYKNLDIHAKEIQSLTIKQILCILKGIKWDRNLDICLWKIRPLYYKLLEKGYNLDSLSGNIGEYYNGKMSYGFLLQKIVYII